MYYLDMVKGRLYTYAPDSTARRAAQTVIYEILSVLARIMAPILVFSAEEIWQNMPKEGAEVALKHVHLADWPRHNPVFAQDDFAASGKDIESELKPVLELVPLVAAELEALRGKGEIGSSFDAQINLLTKDEIRYKYLESLKPELCEIFKVSQVNVEKRASFDKEIVALKACGAKCVRCWNYSDQVGKSVGHPLICEKCLQAIREEK